MANRLRLHCDYASSRNNFMIVQLKHTKTYGKVFDNQDDQEQLTFPVVTVPRYQERTAFTFFLVLLLSSVRKQIPKAHEVMAQVAR